MSKRKLAALLAVSLVSTLLATAIPVGPAHAQGRGSARLRHAVTPAGIFEHIRAFQRIATANDGTRVSGTPGYDRSVRYVSHRLRAAGYHVTVQRFDFDFWDDLAPPVVDPTDPNRPPYEVDTDIAYMTFSGTGDVTRPVIPTNDILIPPGAEPNSSTSGCEPEDFPAAVDGNIALIQRGFCTFEVKAANAQAAGAVGVLIFNEGQEGRTDVLAGTLGRPFTIPVVGLSFEVGAELYRLSQTQGGVTVRLATSTLNEVRPTANVLADSRSGNRKRTIVVGAHLDSVADGPGINDNGSGTGTILEVAEELSELGMRTRNRLRFAFWGAEESGLVGSEHYVANLSNRQIRNIEANINFDMLGSPNFVRFVYDGNGSATGIKGPRGSGWIERIFVRYFSRHGMQSEPTPMDGRSDYASFTAVGIPAGGLFTGAEGIKTEEQEDIYGGQAGIAYDPCYHQACDTIDNVSRRAVNQMSNAVADAVWRLGSRIKPLP